MSIMLDTGFLAQDWCSLGGGGSLGDAPAQDSDHTLVKQMPSVIFFRDASTR